MGDFRRSVALSRAAASTNTKRQRLPRRGLACAIAASAAFLASAPGAHADPISMSFTDPVDQTDPSVDLVSGTFSQDPLTGLMTAHIEFAAAPTPLASNIAPIPVLRLAPGNTSVDGSCGVNKALAAEIFSRRDSSVGAWRYGYNSSWNSLKPNVTETTIDLNLSDPVLHYTTSTCVLITAGTMSSWPSYTVTPVDEVLAKAQLAPTSVGGQQAGNPSSDSDGDGKGDLVDRCPKEPGTGPDGCPTEAGAKAFRLGARRLVVDRYVAKSTSTATCPTKAKVIVKQGGHRLGAAKLAVTASGDGCQVTGAVPLRRHRKRSVVQVVLSGTGLTSVRQQITT